MIKKVLHLNTSDTGGAAVAASRIIKSTIIEGIESELWVNKKETELSFVRTHSSKKDKLRAQVATKMACQVRKIIKTENPLISSAALFPSSWIKKINSSDFELVNLHWFQDEMISINDITKIQKPICLTLHDMWAFCGLEQYTTDFRWRDGYTKENRPASEGGFDINRFIWAHKLRTWKEKFNIICPSNWLYKSAKESVLFKNFPISRIPYPIDTDMWKPRSDLALRERLGIKKDIFLMLICGTNLIEDKRKGIDLLEKALSNVSLPSNKVAIGFLGCDSFPKNYKFSGLNTFPLGRYSNPDDLIDAYNSCDLMIVPSRQDNYPNVVLEAQACGVPVIAFDIGGMPDMIKNNQNGYLVKPFDTAELGSRVVSYINSSLEKKNKFSEMSRKRILSENKNSIISSDYINLYNSIINKNV